MGRRGWPIRIRSDDNGFNQAVAEILQGETTVMEYLFSPVAVTLIQAGRER